jgi:hypothetical protein
VTAAAILAALLLRAPGPAGPPARPAPEAAPAGERAEIDVRFPPWQFTGTFTLAVGGRRDEGVARDRGSVVRLRQPVERVLEGRLGTITLRLETELRGAIYPPLLGRWRVVGATGAWSGLRGGGTFTAADAGGIGGSPFERQTLLGRLLFPVSMGPREFRPVDLKVTAPAR